MRTFYVLVLAISVLFTSCSSQKISKAKTLSTPFIFDPLSIPPSPAHSDECKMPTFNPEANPSPKFPTVGINAKASGFTLLEFQINNHGSTENINIISATPTDVFENASIRTLKGTRFSVNQKWLSSCTNERYRIVYFYHFMSKCTQNEFVPNAINMCATAYTQ